MFLLDRLAEERIAEARDRGDLDDLPGRGRPLPPEELDLVPAELRSAYRLLKNAGYLPEDLQLRREIADAAELLQAARDAEERATAGARLRLLLDRLGRSRAGSMAAQDVYYQRILERVGAGDADSVSGSGRQW